MSYKHIPGLNFPPTCEKKGPRAPIIGPPQLQMLKTCDINSLESLKRYVDQAIPDEKPDVSRSAADGKFRVVKAKELGFDKDSEHRLYEDNIVVRDSILDLSGLRLRDSATLEFTNCIIVGDLKISMSSKQLRKVSMDRCFVLGNIIIHNIQAPDCELYIGDTNCFALEVRSSAIKSIDISTCKISALYLDELNVDDLSIHINKIDYTRLCRISAKKQLIDHKQFDLQKTAAKKPPQHDLLHLPEGFFDIFREYSIKDTDTEDLFLTLLFLREHTALVSDRRSLNTVRLIESSKFQKSIWGELTVRLLGALQKPSYILLVAVAIFLVMTLAYQFLPLYFAQGQQTIQLDFSTACYFSGVTMMTIGYGDIVPLGIARYLAIIEAILGITVWSLYVVALVRKYID